AVHQVPPAFFLKVKQQHTALFWRHVALHLIFDGEDELSLIENRADMVTARDDDDNNKDREEEEEEEEEKEEEDVSINLEDGNKGLTFEEAMEEHINTISDFVNGLEFQMQFHDQQLLQALKREGKSFLCLAQACLLKEK
ncbi:hypothetical protein H0H87_005043, partial [Tephrocybe sp. NHM501043]